MKIGFPAREVKRLIGIPYSTLNLWAKNGLVQPSVSEGAGTGNERLYSFNDVITLKVAFALRSSGISTSSLKKVVEYLRGHEDVEKLLAEARLVVAGNDVAIVRKGELVSVLSKPGQGYLSFVVDLPRMIRELADIADVTNAFAQAIAVERKNELKKKPRSVQHLRRRSAHR